MHWILTGRLIVGVLGVVRVWVRVSVSVRLRAGLLRGYGQGTFGLGL